MPSSYLTGGSVIAAESCLVFLSWSLVGTRLAVRRMEGQKNRNLFISDIWLVVAAIDAAALLAFDVRGFKMGQMDPNATLTDNLVFNNFIRDYLYDVGMYMPKLSIICFYFHITHPTATKMRWALYMLTGYIVCCIIATILSDTFWCGGNVRQNWSVQRINAGGCSIAYSWTSFYVLWSLNISSDVLIFLFPIPTLFTLNLNTIIDKICVGLTFSVGIITMAISIMRIYFGGHSDNFLALFIWGMAELTTAIMVVSLTAFRPLIRRFRPRILSSRSGRTSTSNPSFQSSKTAAPRPNSFISPSQNHSQKGSQPSRRDSSHLEPVFLGRLE